MRHPDFDIETIISYMDGDMSSTTAAQLILSEFEGMTEDDLTQEEIETLDNRISDCQGCGWSFDVENMENIEDIGEMCWRCAADHYESDEDDEDDED